MSDLVTPCDSIEPLLGDYADGEVISASDKERIETHIRTCASCASDLAFFRATNFVVASRFPDVQPPIDVFLRTARATYARPTLRSRMAGWLAPTPVRVGLGTAFAAAVVLAVVVPLTHRESAADIRPVAQADASKMPTGDSMNPVSVAPDSVSTHHGTGSLAQAESMSAPVVRDSRTATGAHTAQPARTIAENTPVRFASRAPITKHTTADTVTQVADVVTPSFAPAAVRTIPTIVQKIRVAKIVIPMRRNVGELARRGGMSERTLPNGDFPKEFVAPRMTLPIEAAPSRIAAETPPVEAITAPSPAHSVVDVPPVPKALHITLAGAGGRVAMAGAIQFKTYHGGPDDSNALVTAPMNDKSDDADASKNTSRGKIP